MKLDVEEKQQYVDYLQESVEKYSIIRNRYQALSWQGPYTVI